MKAINITSRKNLTEVRVCAIVVEWGKHATLSHPSSPILVIKGRNNDTEISDHAQKLKSQRQRFKNTETVQ
jgi:hypothetical protein